MNHTTIISELVNILRKNEVLIDNESTLIYEKDLTKIFTLSAEHGIGLLKKTFCGIRNQRKKSIICVKSKKYLIEIIS